MNNMISLEFTIPVNFYGRTIRENNVTKWVDTQVFLLDLHSPMKTDYY